MTVVEGLDQKNTKHFKIKCTLSVRPLVTLGTVISVSILHQQLQAMGFFFQTVNG